MRSGRPLRRRACSSVSASAASDSRGRPSACDASDNPVRGPREDRGLVFHVPHLTTSNALTVGRRAGQGRRSDRAMASRCGRSACRAPSRSSAWTRLSSTASTWPGSWSCALARAGVGAQFVAAAALDCSPRRRGATRRGSASSASASSRRPRAPGRARPLRPGPATTRCRLFVRVRPRQATMVRCVDPVALRMRSRRRSIPHSPADVLAPRRSTRTVPVTADVDMYASSALYAPPDVSTALVPPRFPAGSRVCFTRSRR